MVECVVTFVIVTEPLALTTLVYVVLVVVVGVLGVTVAVDDGNGDGLIAGSGDMDDVLMAVGAGAGSSSP
jgi:preprotein translocase subunit SecG